jgi:hypothetical protein
MCFVEGKPFKKASSGLRNHTHILVRKNIVAHKRSFEAQLLIGVRVKSTESVGDYGLGAEDFLNYSLLQSQGKKPYSGLCT